jgi:DNA integrity scanning protein DisA with diadenylate cyclase activity
MISQDNLILLDELVLVYQKAYMFKIVCEEQGLTDKVPEINEKMKKLQIQIDILRSNTSKQWVGEINDLIATINKANKDIIKFSEQLKSNIEVNKNIAQFLGWIESLAVFAAQLMP